MFKPFCLFLTCGVAEDDEAEAVVAFLLVGSVIGAEDLRLFKIGDESSSIDLR